MFCTRKIGHNYLRSGCSVFDIAYAGPTNLYSPSGAQAQWEPTEVIPCALSLETLNRKKLIPFSPMSVNAY